MAKWLSYREMKRCQSNVASQVKFQKHNEIQEKRRYLKFIIESLMHCVLQNHALRGNTETAKTLMN